MDSTPTANLPTLLLTRLDRGLSPTIDAQTLAPYGQKNVKELCRRKVLAPLPCPDVVAPCGECDEGCLGMAVVEIDGKPRALCPNGILAPQNLDPLRLERYFVDEKELCFQLRQGNGLTGEGVEALSGGLWLLGWDDAQTPVFALFRCGEASAALAIGAVLSFAQGQKAEIWLPCCDVLPLAVRSAAGCDLTFRDLSMEIDVSDTAPMFRLVKQVEKISEAIDLKPEIIINVDARTVRFRNADVALGPTVFRLLLTLAEHAVKTHESMPSAKLIKSIWGSKGMNEDLRNNLRRLRKGFQKTMGASFDPKSIIHHNAKTGTRLAIPSKLILIVKADNQN